MARKSAPVKSAPVQNPNTTPVSPQIGWVGGRTAPDQAFFDAAAADQRKWLPIPPVVGEPMALTATGQIIHPEG